MLAGAKITIFRKSTKFIIVFLKFNCGQANSMKITSGFGISNLTLAAKTIGIVPLKASSGQQADKGAERFIAIFLSFIAINPGNIAIFVSAAAVVIHHAHGRWRTTGVNPLRFKGRAATAQRECIAGRISVMLFPLSAVYPVGQRSSTVVSRPISLLVTYGKILVTQNKGKKK